jgi:hypothetical protein
MLPLLTVGQTSAKVVVGVKTIFIPLQGSVAVNVTVDAALSHPIAFFALMVYVPAARLLKTFEDWYAPLFMLYVYVPFGDAVTEIDPLLCPVVGDVCVVLMVIVTPLQGFVALNVTDVDALVQPSAFLAVMV